MSVCRHSISCAQVSAATLHAALLPHDWRNILDTSIGLLHGTSSRSSIEQVVQQSGAAFRRLAETAALTAGKVLLRTYLFGPREAAQTDNSLGEQRAGRDRTRDAVRRINAVERLRRLDLMAAPPFVAEVYQGFVAEAAAQDAELSGWLAESLADYMVPQDLMISLTSSMDRESPGHAAGTLAS